MNLSPVELTFKHFEEHFGMPQERLARVAARHSFVELKNSFMRAAADIEGNIGAVIQDEVRRAGEVIELWRLRRPLFDALSEVPGGCDAYRRELMQQLDDAFSEGARFST